LYVPNKRLHAKRLKRKAAPIKIDREQSLGRKQGQPTTHQETFHVELQGVPKKPKSIEINALFEFECPLNLNAKMRKRR
jgi:hypothetical protein